LAIEPLKIFMMESTVAIPGNFLDSYMPRPKDFSTRSTHLQPLSFYAFLQAINSRSWQVIRKDSGACE
jgi:hypothetical protein